MNFNEGSSVNGGANSMSTSIEPLELLETQNSNEKSTEQEQIVKPPMPKRSKTASSEVWKSFTKMGIVDGKEKAKCNGCGKEYVIGSNKYGTSTLLRHISKCVAFPKYHNIGVMMLDQQRKLKYRQLDHKRMYKVLAMTIIEHDLLYLFVEYRRIRELYNLLNSNVKYITKKISDI